MPKRSKARRELLAHEQQRGPAVTQQSDSTEAAAANGVVKRPSDPLTVAKRTSRATWLWRLAALAFVVLGLRYAGVAVADNWSNFKATASSLQPAWTLVVASSLVVLATYGALVQSWRTLIAGAGSTLPFAAAVRIWTIGNLGRYIPGKVASIAALGVMATREGVSPSAAAGAAILGTLINIGAGFGVVALTGSRVLAALSKSYTILAIAGSICFVAGVIALPAILPPLARVVSKRLHRAEPHVQLRSRNTWTAVTINVFSWFCYGWAFMLFSQGILPGIHGSYLQFVAVWTTSYLVGYLALISPGGLGFREGAMIAGLTVFGMTGAVDGAVIAFTTRLWLSVLELLPGLVALAFSARVQGPRPNGPR